MTNAEREMLLAPTTADGMNITCADSASFNLDVDIIVVKWLWLELVLMEFSPSFWPVDLEARECFRIAHYVHLR